MKLDITMSHPPRQIKSSPKSIIFNTLYRIQFQKMVVVDTRQDLFTKDLVLKNQNQRFFHPNFKLQILEPHLLKKRKKKFWTRLLQKRRNRHPLELSQLRLNFLEITLKITAHLFWIIMRLAGEQFMFRFLLQLLLQHHLQKISEVPSSCTTQNPEAHHLLQDLSLNKDWIKDIKMKILSRKLPPFKENMMHC